MAGAAPGAGAAPAATPGKPQLKLIAASNSVTLTRYEWSEGVSLQLGTYVTVDNAPLEFQVTRKSYKDPIVAKQILRNGKTVKTKTLPAGDGRRLLRAARLPGDLGQERGRERGGEDQGELLPEQRLGPDPPGRPGDQPLSAELLHQPVDAGLGVGRREGLGDQHHQLGLRQSAVDLPAGEYTAQVRVAKKYRDLFGIPDNRPTIKVTVREDHRGGEGGEGGERSGHVEALVVLRPPRRRPRRRTTAARQRRPLHAVGPGRTAGPGRSPLRPARRRRSHPARAALRPRRPGSSPSTWATAPATPTAPASRSALKANAKRPTGKASVPKNVPKPDLRSLPAWDIAITDGEDGDVAGKDYLAFSANVWNAGPAPLVVDGFRKPGADLMDAYQYFYDAKGKQIGYTPTGTMEWDPREGHEHWHFTDFASYRLLSADKSKQVRSGKEAFCLANTDAIDYTVKNANWHPQNTDLSTACGSQDAISVREVLDVGSGDTYTQYRPGQSFEITDLPNGTYYIQVIANPENRLKETNHKNNIALRKVVLGGTPGARTVQVPPHDLINAP